MFMYKYTSGIKILKKKDLHRTNNIIIICIVSVLKSFFRIYFGLTIIIFGQQIEASTQTFTAHIICQWGLKRCCSFLRKYLCKKATN